MRLLVVAALLVSFTSAAAGALLPASSSPATLPPPRLDGATSSSLQLSWDAIDGQADALFTLLADDFAEGDTDLGRLVYQGSQNSFTLDKGILPGAPTTFLLIASSAKGSEIGRSPPVSFSSAEAGQCGNAADVTTWIQHRATLHSDTTACMMQGILHGDAAVADCVQSKDGFGHACAACFASLFRCAERHCELSCGVTPSSERCSECIVRQCQSDAIGCTGIPAWAFPDS